MTTTDFLLGLMLWAAFFVVALAVGDGALSNALYTYLTHEG